MAFLYASIYFKIGYDEFDRKDPVSYRRFCQNMGGALFFGIITNFMGTYQSVLLTCKHKKKKNP